MLRYKPTHLKYTVDTSMIPSTQQNQTEINKSKDDSRRKIGRTLAEDLQFSNFAKKSKNPRIAGCQFLRLCGNITQLYMHLKSAEILNKQVNACKVYGKVDYSKCSNCGLCLYLMTNKGKSAGQTCFFDYHNDIFWFGT